VQHTVIFVAMMCLPHLEGAAHRNICSNDVFAAFRRCGAP
jgi:hypothetical protein